MTKTHEEFVSDIEYNGEQYYVAKGCILEEISLLEKLLRSF